MDRPTLTKAAIIAFCLWHMAAVGLYAMPLESSNPVMEWLEETARPMFRPYTLILSQWQRWNLFSPNPLRRVTEFVIEAEENGEWRVAGVVNAATVPLRSHADELKTIRRLDEQENDLALRHRYISLMCPELGLAPGTTIRLRKRWYVIPLLKENESSPWWSDWEPAWREKIEQPTQCLSA